MVKQPFKFGKVWTKDETSWFVVEKAWKANTQGSLVFKVCQKLKGAKKEFIIWNNKWFGNIQQSFVEAKV